MLVVGVLLAAETTPCAATELVYRPISPGFGGHPLNDDYVFGTAQSNDRSERKVRRPFDDPSQRFVRTLQASLMGNIARQVADAIFGENARDSGTFTFGDVTVNFDRGVETVRIDILDAANGTTTTIEVPLLQVE